MENYYREREIEIKKVDKNYYMSLFEIFLDKLQEWIKEEKVGPHTENFYFDARLWGFQDLFVQFATHKLPSYEITYNPSHQNIIQVRSRYSTVQEYIVALLQAKCSLVIPQKTKFDAHEIDHYLNFFFDSLDNIDDNSAQNEYFILRKKEITDSSWEWTFQYNTNTRIALERHIQSLIHAEK